MTVASDKTARLKQLLIRMDVPETRRDVTVRANMLWLSRNLAVNNRQHPAFTEATGLIWGLLRDHNA